MNETQSFLSREHIRPAAVLSSTVSELPTIIPRPSSDDVVNSPGARSGRHVEWDSTLPAEDTRRRPPPPSHYPGRGTIADPYLVDWDLGDPENPYNWPTRRKWLITSQLALGTWTVSFSSSSYSGGMEFLRQDIPMSEEVVVLGISLYVLGFGCGPLLFAPLSEMFGRRRIFLFTFSTYMLFHLGGALGHNVATILATRLLAGVFGSSPLTNAGGAIADIFNARERGIASAIYSTAPYLGPVIGPIVGGFVAQNSKLGWRFNFWLMLILSAVNFVYGVVVTPETYGPVLLRRRARRLEKESGGSVKYITAYDMKRHMSLKDIMRINLTRPFRFMVTEPIVAVTALYISITYATLYAQFSAFPIVFQEHRGFNAGEGGLAFLGIGTGVLVGTAMAPLQNVLYWRAMAKSPWGQAPPEARLYLAMAGGLLLPLGLFWFAWTTFPSIHWIVPILGGIPIGAAIAFILQSLTAYMMDAYTIYFASAIAATVLLRSLFALAFPLFSPVMFRALGDQWGCTVFALLAVVCAPVPVLFKRYGKWLRGKSKFAWKEPESDPSDGPGTWASSQTTTVREKEKESE